MPVVVHAEHKIYVPELIFGNLLTSSNYDDNEKKGQCSSPLNRVIQVSPTQRRQFVGCFPR